LAGEDIALQIYRERESIRFPKVMVPRLADPRSLAKWEV